MNLTETTNRRYRVELTDGARKDLKKLRQHREQIGEALGRLETNPLAGHALWGSLYNLRALEFIAKGRRRLSGRLWCARYGRRLPRRHRWAT
jgi:hypothetical protein